MKTSLLFGATLAILGLAAAPVDSRAQTTSTTTSTSTGYVQASKIVGTRVKTAQGEEIGEVKDVVLDLNTGCMAYTVLSTGGTGTRVVGQAKTVAVPWAIYSTTSDPRVLTVRVDRDRVYNAPAFDYARIDEYSSSGWINNVYSYYGVAAGVGAGVGVSGTTTTGTYGTQGTQTGVSGQVNTAASPGVAPSPAATAMASPSASVATSPAAAPRATTSPSAKASPGTTASRRASATPSSEAESTGERKTHRHG